MRPIGVLLLALLVVSVCVLIAGCTSPEGNATPEATPPTAPETGTPAAPNMTVTETTSASGDGNQSLTVDLTAQNIAFDTNTITVPAGAQVTIRFTNLDSVPHNVAVYETSQANEAIFVGEIINQGEIAYTFTAPGQPGTYFFRCDVHPTTMTGDFIVR